MIPMILPVDPEHTRGGKQWRKLVVGQNVVTCMLADGTSMNRGHLWKGGNSHLQSSNPTSGGAVSQIWSGATLSSSLSP